MLDTGATLSYMPIRMAHRWELPRDSFAENPIMVKMANAVLVPITATVTVPIEIYGKSCMCKFLLINCEELSLGLDFIRKCDVGISIPNMSISMKGVQSRIPLSYDHHIWKLWPTPSKEPSNIVVNAASLQSSEDVEKFYQVLDSFRPAMPELVHFKVSEQTVVPPGMKCRIPVKSSSESAMEIVTEPSESGLELLILPERQSDSSLTNFLFVSNFNSFPVTLPKGIVIAHGSEVVEITTWECMVQDPSNVTIGAPTVTTVKDVTDEEAVLNSLQTRFRELVVKDIFRVVSKNKSIPSYPVQYDPGDVHCKRIAVAEGLRVDREPKFSSEKSASHPNNKSGITIKDFDFGHYNINPKLSEQEQKRVKELIFKFRKDFCYSKYDLKDLDRSKLPAMTIDTGDHPPIKCHPYRRSPKEKMVIEVMIKELLACGVIIPIDSPYASPIVMVKKKNGEYRMCVDYRKLNNITVKDRYPLPLISDALDSCAGAKYFSTLDVFSGYHLLPIHEESIPKTAFCCHLGLFAYTVIPFGLSNAPSKFMRVVDSVLSKLRGDSVFWYLDDIIVTGRTFSEHQDKMDQVISLLSSVNLKLNPAKCYFAYPEIDFLGHVVSAEGIKPAQRNVEKVQNMARPKSQTQCRRFLGMAGFYRSFIKNFARLAAPLHKVAATIGTFIWDSECQNSFEQLIQELTSFPVKSYFRDECETEIHTDASHTGLGAVLRQLQPGPDGTEEWRVIYYWSRGLKKYERNYSSTEIELLAVLESCYAFRPYILGREFTVVTDHSALTSLVKGGCNNGARSEGRLNKFRLLLNEFGPFKVNYKKGCLHAVPDTLSRMDQEEEEPKDFDDSPMFFRITPMAQDELENISPGQSFSELQYADPFCRSRMEDMERYKNKFTMSGKVLYRHWKTKFGKSICAVLPMVLVQETLKRFHDGEEGVHPGQFRTIKLIRDKFWWVTLKKDVVEYVQKCDHCTFKKPAKFARPEFQPVVESFDVSGGVRPFAQICMDFKDFSHRETFRKNKYVVVVCCYLTKYVIAGALPDIKTKTVLDWFEKAVLSHWSAPVMIVSDNGSQFTAQQFRAFSRAWGIDHRKITPYKASSNGQVERMNATFAEALSPFVSSKHKDWDIHLDKVIYGINCLTSTVTGISPFEAVRGYKPRTVFDNTLEVPDIVKDNNGEEDPRIKICKNCWQKVLKAGEKLRRKKVVRNWHPTFEVGDQCVILNHQVRTGLYKGFLHLYKPFPYTVTNVLRKNVYRVRANHDPDDCHTVNVSEMKKYYSTDPLSIKVPEDQIQCPERESDGTRKATTEETVTEDGSNDKVSGTDRVTMDSGTVQRGKVKKKVSPPSNIITRSQARKNIQQRGSSDPSVAAGRSGTGMDENQVQKVSSFNGIILAEPVVDTWYRIKQE